MIKSLLFENNFVNDDVLQEGEEKKEEMVGSHPGRPKNTPRVVLEEDE